MNSAFSKSSLSRLPLMLAAAVLLPQEASAGGPALSVESSRPALYDYPLKADSAFLAGYRTKKTVATLTSASNTFTVPSVTCTSAVEGIALGIGNEKKQGKPTVIAVVFVGCNNSLPFYELFAQAGKDADAALTVNAGDIVEVSFSVSGPIETATIKDVTTGTTITASGGPKKLNTQLTFGAFPLFTGVDPLPVPDFGSVQMKSNTLNSAPIEKATVQSVVRKAGATTQISVGNLSGGKFTLSFVSH